MIASSTTTTTCAARSNSRGSELAREYPLFPISIFPWVDHRSWQIVKVAGIPRRDSSLMGQSNAGDKGVPHVDRSACVFAPRSQNRLLPCRRLIEQQHPVFKIAYQQVIETRLQLLAMSPLRQ